MKDYAFIMAAISLLKESVKIKIKKKERVAAVIYSFICCLDAP
jgi:hypothetical protein